LQALVPGLDLASSLAALAFVLGQAGAPLLPAVLLAPLVLVSVSWLLGLYALTRSGPGAPDPSVLGRRLLASAAFAWSAALLAALGGGDGGLGPGLQVAIWLGAFSLGLVARWAASPLLRRADRPERWVVVGDSGLVERLKAYEPLRPHARVVCSVSPPNGEDPLERESALSIVDSNDADRVVIAARDADDRSLVALIKSFRSAGVAVSMLPRPLDLLEAPGAAPGEVAGVPLIEVTSLAARQSTPYRGPERRQDRRPRVSVVIPAMNEAKNIGHVLERLPEDLHEVILVDGSSKDETVAVAVAARPDIRVLNQLGSGKGDALRTGFAAVTGNLIVMLDADGSARPEEIPSFVGALLAGADFAKGSRFLAGGGSSDITPIRRLGNAFLSGTVNLVYGTRFTDLCYGYNAFWTRCLPFISLDAPGFEVETLINLRIAAAGLQITEVPSHETERISGQSNLKTFRDGFRVLFTILREAPQRPVARRREARARRAALVTSVRAEDPQG
jgi:hypothetical protein